MCWANGPLRILSSRLHAFVCPTELEDTTKQTSYAELKRTRLRSFTPYPVTQFVHKAWS